MCAGWPGSSRRLVRVRRLSRLRLHQYRGRGGRPRRSDSPHRKTPQAEAAGLHAGTHHAAGYRAAGRTGAAAAGSHGRRHHRLARDGRLQRRRHRQGCCKGVAGAGQALTPESSKTVEAPRSST
ncbi:hypothetical protein G6F57_022410 [Rhizopus arrhizus]|nr:hypothetical protein G6F57_022410 [Rhizopus arrhizus]